MNQDKLWEPSRRIELQYARALKNLARTLIRIAKGHRPEDMIKILQDYAASKAFKSFAEKVAMKMVTGLFKDVGHSWRRAAAKNGKGKELYQALIKELQQGRGAHLDWLIRDNTYRIVTLPEEIGKDVAGYINRETLKGRRASDLEKEIAAMFPEHTQARAELIARTQVSYTQTNLIRVRAESMGLNWYEWHPVGGYGGDGRTRKSHRMMAGVLVNWNDPPAPEDLFPTIGKNGMPYRNKLGHYHAGQAPNCRCVPLPIVDIDEIESWPARVYYNGSVVRMGRRQFESIL